MVSILFMPNFKITAVCVHNTDACYCRRRSDDARYVTRSSLMSGALPSLSQLSGRNSSYALDFWGTTLHCETNNRTDESEFYNSGFYTNWMPGTQELTVFNFTKTCRLMSDVQSLESLGNTAIIYRTVDVSMNQLLYYPCWDNNKTSTIEGNLTQVPSPDPGINVLFPVTETVCRPKLRKYSITVSSDAFEQHISVSLGDEEYIPAYTSDFRSFNGSYELWVHFSDALSIYNEFAANLNSSYFLTQSARFWYVNSGRRSATHTLSNGTIVETCTLRAELLHRNEQTPLEVWPLSVFERRLTHQNVKLGCSRFDVEMAKELLINTTISALALNKRFRVVNGTEMRTFNVYQFKNRLAFFIPYGLSIGLGIPIIALGLLSFYIHNQGVSAINGGFLQLLMTTTGRTGLEDVVIKHFATMGGYENVSDELKTVEVRFGELIEVGADEQDGKLASPRPSSEQVDNIEMTQHDGDSQDNGAEAASVVDTLEKNEPGSGRFGFGLAHEVRPLRRRNVG